MAKTRKPLPRSQKRIKKRSVTRGGRGSDKPKLAWMRGLQCLVAEKGGRTYSPCTGLVEAHHHRPLGAPASDKRTVPLCATGHHREGRESVETLGRKGFQTFHSLDLDRECVHYETMWQASK